MPEIDRQMAHFFAWARERAYAEFDRLMSEDPTLDPNWTFSDIMQRLLDQYQKEQPKAESGQSQTLPGSICQAS